MGAVNHPTSELWTRLPKVNRLYRAAIFNSHMSRPTPSYSQAWSTSSSQPSAPPQPTKCNHMRSGDELRLTTQGLEIHCVWIFERFRVWASERSVVHRAVAPHPHSNRKRPRRALTIIELHPTLNKKINTQTLTQNRHAPAHDGALRAIPARTKREQINASYGLVPKIQGQKPALTVLYVP